MPPMLLTLKDRAMSSKAFARSWPPAMPAARRAGAPRDPSSPTPGCRLVMMLERAWVRSAYHL